MCALRDLQVLGRLTRAGYTLVTSRDAFPQELRGRDRELRAAVEYHLGLRAERWGQGRVCGLRHMSRL